jgi:hypothetical protein
VYYRHYRCRHIQEQHRHHRAKLTGLALAQKILVKALEGFSSSFNLEGFATTFRA